VVHDATRRANTGFLDQQGRAVVPIPGNLRGMFRVEVGRAIGRGHSAALAASRAAAAPSLGSGSPKKTTRQVVESTDGALTVTLIEHRGGFLEIHAQAHWPQLRNASVHLQFRAADGGAISLHGADHDPVDVTIPLSRTRDGEPFGAWMNKVNVPRDVSHVDIVVFPVDEAAR
jgi:hypothetical protein